MIDTYLMADSFDALATFCASFRNIQGPAPGRAETAETTDESGNVIPAQAAAGDPAKFYACVRAPVSVEDSMDVCDAATGRAVLGIWEE